MQIKLGEIHIKETMKGAQDLKFEPCIKIKEINKSNHRDFIFYRNGRVITCICKSGKFKGVGVAKCNPKDEFDMAKGAELAEMRARQDFYKKFAEYVAKR